jgi:hypothetical protein
MLHINKQYVTVNNNEQCQENVTMFSPFTAEPLANVSNIKQGSVAMHMLKSAPFTLPLGYTIFCNAVNDINVLGLCVSPSLTKFGFS